LTTPYKWDVRFLSTAKHIAEWSKDPSTQVGAVAVRDRRILATGYNGFPRGVLDLPTRLLDRPQKLLRTVHAEANIVAQAARNGVCLENATVYVWPFIPCNACCTLLIQTGFARVVAPDMEIPDRWIESFTMSKEMFSEAGVKLTLIDPHLVEPETYSQKDAPAKSGSPIQLDT
jgi:dCMP deaminase